MKKVGKLALFSFSFLLLASSLWATELLTRAEKSSYTETTRYAEVMDFLKNLQIKSTEIRVLPLTESTEGRTIPLVILGSPAPASPKELRRLGKPAIYIQANIHAGEVEGKEAMLMLMREILLGKLHHLLDNQVLLITPIYNPDGNEKISKTNRTNQHGPTGGVGVRYNGQHLDLNRDYIKLESPEDLAAVEKILNLWDPMLLMDLHTTNGSYHIEPLTYATAHNPNGDMTLPDYLRKKLLPHVTRVLEKEYGILSIPYGFFRDATDPAKGWGTFNHQPYYGTNYWGLRNRFSILDENYAYADFKTRVEACYHFVEQILEYTNKHTPEMVRMIEETDAKAVDYGTSADTSKRFGTEFKAETFEKPILIRGYDFEIYKDQRGRQRAKKLDTRHDYTVPFYGDFQITKSVVMAKGYLFPAHLKEIAAKLAEHGIFVEKLTQPVSLEAETFHIKKAEHSKRMFQGHLPTTLTGEYRKSKIDFPEGTYFVGMNQPLANLAAYLLEPTSDGGLVFWNFFDRYLYISQWGRQFGEFPVYRLLKPTALAKMAAEAEEGQIPLFD
ncbi:MAG: M14 family metallopeptidase [Calditrichaeota bacterium]|nr:M14 family metallopeptidase [Calditrichota bacterium]